MENTLALAMRAQRCRAQIDSELVPEPVFELRLKGVAADAKLTQDRRLKIDPPQRRVLRSGGPYAGSGGSGGDSGLETAGQKHPRDRADARGVTQHGASLSAGRRAAAVRA